MNEAEIDRLAEIANIGAGHAATAFSHLAGGCPILMHVPKLRQADEPFFGAAREGGDWSTGVFFAFEGHLTAMVGILFRSAASEAVVRTVVGEPEEPLSPHSIESALMEIGNILASHVASAIADTLGVRLLPSIPTLAMSDAQREFMAAVAAREGAHPIRIECELSDDAGELEGLLILIPEGAGLPSV